VGETPWERHRGRDTVGETPWERHRGRDTVGDAVGERLTLGEKPSERHMLGGPRGDVEQVLQRGEHHLVA
jgi:hypothetical protein